MLISGNTNRYAAVNISKVLNIWISLDGQVPVVEIKDRATTGLINGLPDHNGICWVSRFSHHRSMKGIAYHSKAPFQCLP